MIHPESSEALIGAAMKVLNTLKPDLNEKAYENATLLNLKHADLRWKRIVG
jgi:PD-(D/E)XK nuclease superfamily